MSKITVTTLTIVLILVAGCGKATPTATQTPAPSTATQTPIPPTATATPTATAIPTSIPPTPTPTPNITVQEVNFSTDDGLSLAGTLFGEGEIAVILAHMGEPGVTQASWESFARLIAARGFAALTFDFRGRGRSEGFLQHSQLIHDMNAAIAFLQEQGYERIACVGASMGGTACLRAALDHDLAGLVVIASTMTLGDPTRVRREEFAQLTMPKLYVAAQNDLVLASAATFMYKLSPEPTELVIYPGQSAHGTRLFSTSVGHEFRALLVSFLEQLRVGTQPTPGSGLIAFYSERDGNNGEIYVMNSDGSDQRRLTHNDADDNCPAWSPDGAHIAFTSDRHDPAPRTCFPHCNYELYLMPAPGPQAQVNADGSDQRRLTDTPAAELHPAWSPDGAYLMFDADYDGDGQGTIYVLEVQQALQGKGDPQPLTDGQADDRWADWSPDGAHIAFSSNRDGNYEIYVMPAPGPQADADGGSAQRLTDSDANDLFPAWSPDGTQIAFFSMRPGSRRQDIYVMQADGSNLQQLTDSPRVVDEDPAWSPDGSQIVFQSDRDGNYEIYVMNRDGSEQRRLTDNRSGDYWPAWQPAATGAPSSATRPADDMVMVYVPGGRVRDGQPYHFSITLPLFHDHRRSLANLGRDLKFVHQSPGPGQAHAQAPARRITIQQGTLDVGDARPLVAGDNDDAVAVAALHEAEDDLAVPGVCNDIAPHL
jgi:Tol biopolymer transport system component/predicted alpha/beta-hydrolase family hydrolase